MKKVALIGVIVAIVLGVGCQSRKWEETGGTSFPKPTAGYKPTSILSASRESVSKVLPNIINKAGVSVLKGDVSLALPLTLDFIPGPFFKAKDLLYGIGYRYQLVFSYSDKLNINVLFEETHEFDNEKKLLTDEKQASPIREYYFEQLEKLL